ncbi:MAG: ABC transporter ATP-binding protein [Gammaproteobacteria bacterium]|nr:ABC transporter ATP-binding protein [Gammaproteobacteria bacterium]
MTKPTIVHFAGVSKRFGDVVAVDKVDLEIAEGEFFALLGGSGCGKTTLLRLLAGFERPSEGRVLIAGEDVTEVPPHRRPVNMMFQSYALFPHMNVAANVAFGLKQEGIEKGEIAERVSQVLRLVELAGLDKRRPDQLSGGQRQRVALARALVKRPRVLLLDEPLAALDKRLREQTQFELMRIQDEVGITFVVVTHDQEEAMSLATRIGVMNAGRIVQTGTPRDIYESPANRFVADFIGSVNLFDATVESATDATITITVAELGRSIVVEQNGRPSAGTPCAFALRPEKIRVARAEPDATNKVAGVVKEIGYLGASCIFRVRTADGRVVQATQSNQSRDLSLAYQWEEPVWISWPEASGVLLFD